LLRAKTVSNYSEADLAAIVGSRPKTTQPVRQVRIDESITCSCENTQVVAKEEPAPVDDSLIPLKNAQVDSRVRMIAVC
jgi:hypothetical protein